FAFKDYDRGCARPRSGNHDPAGSARLDLHCSSPRFWNNFEGVPMKRLTVVVAVALIAVLLPLYAQVGKSVGLLDANRATEQELMGVAHLDATLVKAIMDKRPFANVTELTATLTPALTSAQLNEAYGKIFVHVNLNTATDDEL